MEISSPAGLGCNFMPSVDSAGGSSGRNLSALSHYGASVYQYHTGSMTMKSEGLTRLSPVVFVELPGWRRREV